MHNATIGTEGVSVVCEDDDSDSDDDEPDIRDYKAFTDTTGVFAADATDDEPISEAWKGSVLYASYPDKRQRSSAHTIGKVVLDNEMNGTEFVTALCDSGALDANYLAKRMLDLIRSRLPDSAFFSTRL